MMMNQHLKDQSKSIILGISSGIGIFLISGGVNLFRGVGFYLWNSINERIYYRIDIDSKDKSFGWLLYWLSENEFIKHSNHLNAETDYNSVGKNPKIILVPSVGKHCINYKGKSIWINRERDSAFDMGAGSPFESISISTYRKDKEYLNKLLQEAMQLSLNKDIGKTVIYVNGGNGRWERFGNPRSIRSLNSVILPLDLKTQLLDDIKQFITNENWYRNRGIPYRRGYLLYGEPGNGKSSLINAIAGELNLDICIVSLSQKDIDDKQINHLLNNAPPKSILLIEDIDAAFKTYRDNVDSSSTNKNNNNTSSNNGLTYSGLLNALDGVASQEGRILFMTTNKIELLDSALIREGRIDLKIKVSNATKQQAAQLFTHFYNLPSNNELSIKFSSSLQDYQLSMSQIQGFLLKYINSPEKAIEEVQSLTPFNIQN